MYVACFSNSSIFWRLRSDTCLLITSLRQKHQICYRKIFTSYLTIPSKSCWKDCFWFSRFSIVFRVWTLFHNSQILLLSPRLHVDWYRLGWRAHIEQNKEGPQSALPARPITSKHCYQRFSDWLLTYCNAVRFDSNLLSFLSFKR